MKITKRKKVEPMKQVTMASPKEGDSTAYVPVINATAIASMATKVSKRAKTNKQINFRNNLSDRMKWTKTAESERTMAMASDTANA